MSRAWMPLYVGDFLADTMHLGATETGIYVRLLMHCWQHGTIPNDDRKLARIAGCDSRLWRQYRETVLQFFDLVDAVSMQHKRVTEELRRCAEISNKRKAAALQKHSKSTTNAEQLHTQSQSPSQPHKNLILNGGGEGVKRAKPPRHGTFSRDNKFIYCRTGTPEYAAYAEDYRIAHKEEPTANPEGGRWFSVLGESPEFFKRGG